MPDSVSHDYIILKQLTDSVQTICRDRKKTKIQIKVMFRIVYKGLDCIKCIFNEIQTPAVVKMYFYVINKIDKRQSVPSEDSRA